MGRRAATGWQLPPVRKASGHAAPLREVHGEAPSQERGLDAETQGQK